MKARRAAVLALPAISVAAVGAVVATSLGGDGTGDPARAAGERSGIRTVAVARRTLVDRQRVDGTLGFAGKRSATNRLSGTITWLPHTGRVIRPGGTLFRVDGKPVVLMNGTLPAYRTLKPGIDAGADVRQLERNLSALGYDPGFVDTVYTASTAAAVRAWQDNRGLAKTGQVELGRVVFLPGTRRVSDVKSSLGSAASNSGDGDDAGMRFASTTAPTTPTKTTPTTPTTPTTTTPATPAAKDDPSGGDGNDNGNGNAPATEVLGTTSTRRVITAKVDAADQQLAIRGRRVRVELPDGRIVSGRIASVGTVAASDSGQDNRDPEADSTPKITITIRLRSARAAGRLDQAPVSVQLARTTRRRVLAVPVQALVARQGGRYAVELAGGRLVGVVPGLFADGYVELTGGRIREGDRVRVPE